MFPKPDNALQLLLDELDFQCRLPEILTRRIAKRLDKIRLLGSPAALPYLLPFVHSAHAGVRRAAELTVSTLLPQLSADQFLELAALLRESWLKFFADGHEFRAEGHAGWKLSTMSPSGWRRERAVLKLAEARDTSALMFVLLRLNDWVVEVRQAAERWIWHCEGSLQTAQIFECIPVLAALQERRQASSSRFVRSLTDRLATKEAASGLLKALPSLGARSRRFVFSLLSQSGSLSTSETQAHLLQQSDPVLGATLLNRLKMDHGELPDQLINVALSSKSALLRRAALYSLWPSQIDRFVPSLWEVLLDPTQSLRQFARFYLLRHATAEELQARYLAVLKDKGASNRAIVTSILGFHECGGTWEVAQYWQWSEHPSMRVRAAVMQCFATSHLEESLPWVRNAIGAFVSSSLGRTAFEILQKHPHALSLDEIRNWLHESRPEALRFRAFLLLTKRDKGEKLPVFLKLSRDPFEKLRKHAMAGLRAWLQYFNRSPVQPSPDQIKEAAAELSLSKKFLEEPLFRELEFLLGLASRVPPLRRL